MSILDAPPEHEREFGWKWIEWFRQSRDKTIPRYTIVTQNAVQTLTTATDTLLEWDEVNPTNDPEGLFDTDTNEFVVPAETKLIRLSFSVSWQANLSSGARVVWPVAEDINGDDATASDRIAQLAGLPRAAYFDTTDFTTALGQFWTMSAVGGIMAVQGGDRFSLYARHDRGSDTGTGNASGDDYDRSTWFQMEVLG